MYEAYTMDNRLNFLHIIYFGSSELTIEVACKRAYLDLCRTIKYSTKKSGVKYRDEVINTVLKAAIEELCMQTCQKNFDKKHDELCKELIRFFKDKAINFAYGHAQKWVNMAVKYLYVFGDNDKWDFGFAHMPLDSYVFKALDKEKIKCPIENKWADICWSKIGNNEENEKIGECYKNIVKQYKIAYLIS